MRSGGLMIDSLGLILKEYLRKLGYAGQPGAGEKFAKWAWSNQATPEAVTVIGITPFDHGWRRFIEFPDVDELRKFDRSDQKFVAVALASGRDPPILNAVDSDWWTHSAALARIGVQVEHLCPQHAPNA